jgi:isopentenyl phosphate kinase
LLVPPELPILVKLGGSVITDKTRPETPRPEILCRLAEEVAAARAARPGLPLVLGHGSGSFGHVLALRHGTHRGVMDAAGWHGFAEVAAAAARLNRLVTDIFLAAGVPVWSLQPSASARCRAGELLSLEAGPVHEALAHGLVPLVYGDVALDEAQGATIISTEQILAVLAAGLRPARMILLGVVDGVYEADPLRDPAAHRIPHIGPDNWPAIRQALGGSHAADVTGGMAAKVEGLVALLRRQPGMQALILSGERPGALLSALLHPEGAGGTSITWR